MMVTIIHSTQNRKLAFIMGKSLRILKGNIKSTTKRNTNQLTQPQNDLLIFFFLLLVWFKSNPNTPDRPARENPLKTGSLGNSAQTGTCSSPSPEEIRETPANPPN